MTNKELAIYEEMAMVTVKGLEKDAQPVFRFIKWAMVESLFDEVNSKRVVRIGDEIYPSRNIEKIEKVTGRVPTKEVLHLLEEKIARYRSTNLRMPSEKTLNIMTENCFKELYSE